MRLEMSSGHFLILHCLEVVALLNPKQLESLEVNESYFIFPLPLYLTDNLSNRGIPGSKLSSLSENRL